MSLENSLEHNISDSQKCKARIIFFFKCMRNTNTPLLYSYLKECAKENLVDTFLLVFNLRDCRHGKGERRLAKKAFIWLFLNYPKEFTSIVHLIPEYGRWDDVLSLWPKILQLRLHSAEFIQKNYDSKTITEDSLVELRNLQLTFVTLLGNQLIQDKENMEKGQSISLCAKWAPSEKDSLNQRFKIVPLLVKQMKWSLKEYRSVYLTPLRQYLDIVERKMCSQEWEDINFSKVPSQAIHRLKNAFEKHTPENFREWKNQVILGEEKINSKQIFPHELIVKIKYSNNINDFVELQWAELETKYNNFSDAVFLIDVSQSMHSWQWRSKHEVQNLNFTPVDIAIALGILGSNSVNGEFHNHIISFHSKPSFTVLPDSSLFERFNIIKNMGWAGSTNLYAVFELILKQAKCSNLPTEKMPKRLFIISDMQFDAIEGYTNKTKFQAIEKLYASSNYNIPQIIFWNVAGDVIDVPVDSNKQNTALLSGFSLNLINSVFSNVKLSPYDMMRNVLDNEHYLPIKNCIQASQEN